MLLLLCLLFDTVQDAVLLQSANWETGTFDEGGEHCEVCCACQFSFTYFEHVREC
jgi:hypothetical protein